MFSNLRIMAFLALVFILLTGAFLLTRCISKDSVREMENGTIANADNVFRAVRNYIEEYEHCPLSVEGFVTFLPQERKLDNFFTKAKQSEPRLWEEFLREGIATAGGIYYQSLPNSTFSITAYGSCSNNNEGPLRVLNGFCPEQ